MSGIDLNTESVEEVRAKLDDLKVRYGFSEPDRGDLEDPDIVWRDSKPDYTKANYQFLKGKTQNHAEGRYVVTAWHSNDPPMLDHGNKIKPIIIYYEYAHCTSTSTKMYRYIVDT